MDKLAVGTEIQINFPYLVNSVGNLILVLLRYLRLYIDAI